METVTRKFSLEKTRSKGGRIVDAIGNLGNWPFRQTISYNVGVNCDSIEEGHGLLRVLRHGRTVAIAVLPPPVGFFRRLLNWRAVARSSQSWDDFLRPRR